MCLGQSEAGHGQLLFMEQNSGVSEQPAEPTSITLSNLPGTCRDSAAAVTPGRITALMPRWHQHRAGGSPIPVPARNSPGSCSPAQPEHRPGALQPSPCPGHSELNLAPCETGGGNGAAARAGERAPGAGSTPGHR